MCTNRHVSNSILINNPYVDYGIVHYTAASPVHMLYSPCLNYIFIILCITIYNSCPGEGYTIDLIYFEFERTDQDMFFRILSSNTHS